MPAADDGAVLSRFRYAFAANRVLEAAAAFQQTLKAGFRPDQPRVPAGRPDGGQWTDDDFGGSLIYVQSRRRSGGSPRNIAGRLLDATPAEQARLEISHAQMQAALRRVRQLDPKWKPTPNAYETIEGQITANEATTREALDRLYELQRVGIGRGPFAVESQPARGPSRRWTAEEIRENNRIGRKYGCHTCGTRESGSPSGNFVIDHQDPTALNGGGKAQRIFPQCLTCSRRQGGIVTTLKKGVAR